LKTELPTDFGVLTVEAADASLDITPTTGDVKAKAKLSAAEGNILRLESDGLYVPAPDEVSLPSYEDSAVDLSFVTKVDQINGEIDPKKAALVQGDNITLTQNAVGGDITIAAKSWANEIAVALAEAQKYADDNDANDNTAHTHAVGAGLTLGEVKGGIEGEVLTSLNLAFVDDSENKRLKLVDATDNTKVIAEFDTTEFIADGMLESVVADQSNNTLTFTWNTDGNKTVTVVELSSIADIYTGKDGTTVKVDVSNTNEISAEVKAGTLKDAHIAADAAIAETKLAQGVRDALALARTALQEHQDVSNKKDKQEEKSGTLAGAKVVASWSQNANGELTVTSRDLTPNDIGAQPAGNYKTTQTAVADKITSAAHVLDSLTQNANGEISYTVKTLTPADIDAQPAGNYQVAGDYKTKQDAYTAEGSTVKTVTKVEQNANGEVAITYSDIAFPEFPELPSEDDFGVLSVSGDEGIAVDNTDAQNPVVKIADKGVTTAKIADKAVSAE